NLSDPEDVARKLLVQTLEVSCEIQLAVEHDVWSFSGKLLRRQGPPAPFVNLKGDAMIGNGLVAIAEIVGDVARLAPLITVNDEDELAAQIVGGRPATRPARGFRRDSFEE